MSGARRTTAAFLRNRTGVLGAAILLGIVAFCVLVPLISPYDANTADFTAVREPPNGDHWLGTDQYGRDILTRLAAGGRTTLLIAGAALGVILVLGVGYGATSGILGGRVDTAMMRLLDGLLAIPRLPVSIVILVFVGLQAQNIQTVVGEAFLAVLGLGPEAPTATWGNIALEGITFGRLWLVFLPSLAIGVLAVAASLFADGLGDSLDPRRWPGRNPRRFPGRRARALESS